MNAQWISTDPWGTPIKSDGPNKQPFMLFKSKGNFVKNIKRNVNLSYLLMKQIWGKKHTVSMRSSYATRSCWWMTNSVLSSGKKSVEIDL